MQIISNDWEDDIIKLANLCGTNKSKLWSFEVKKEITPSNVRAVFFQTVSNSSWAHYSYLVAPSIDDRAMKELQILCKGHNIGVILLNTESPNESVIKIQAYERPQLDFGTINKLYRANSDFKKYIDQVSYFLNMNKINSKEWDITE